RLRRVARVERLRRLAEPVNLDAAVDVQPLRDRQRRNAAGADEAERVIPPRELVVVADAQANSYRHRDPDATQGPPGRGAEPEIPACLETAIELSDAWLRIQLERGERVRLD